MKTPRERLDVEVVRRGLAQSRQRSQGLIIAGKVLVNGQKSDKPGTGVSDDDVITIIGEDMPYVSRGGLKLKGALDRFQVDVSGLVCADIGASTGGFTDCMLQEGAAKVYALDVGYGLLDYRIRTDPKVVVIERFNARTLGADTFGEPVGFATIDVSFISLRLILGPVSTALSPDGRIIALVKPQFEVGKGNLGKGGIVRDDRLRLEALEGIKEFALSAGYRILGEMESPITGAKGNIEYLLCLEFLGVPRVGASTESS